MNFRKLFWPLLIVVLALPTVLPLFQSGIFKMQDDISVMRLFQMQKCFADGQVPCRWVPDMGFGYGYPQFEYYGPLPYYIQTVFHAVGLDLYSAVKLGFGLALILGSVAMFYLAAQFFGPIGGLVSAVAYSYAPYRSADLYLRGAMGESWAFVFFPLILLALTRTVRKSGSKNIIFFAVSYAGLLTSHNISTLMFTPFAALWGLVLILFSVPTPAKGRVFRFLAERVGYLFLGGLLAISLAGFFFLPVIFETRFAHTESLLSGYFNYLAHFVSFKQLFFTSFWGFGSSEIGFTDDISFSYGFIHLLTGLTAALIALKSLVLRKIKTPEIVVLVSILIFLFASFLVHEKSSIIWKLIPILSYLQFPWRFLTVANFFLCFVAGFVVYRLQFSSKLYLTSGLIFSLILFNLAFFRPYVWHNQNSLEKFSGESWEKQQTISIFDYLPIAAKYPPATSAPVYPTTLSGGPVSILDFYQGSDRQSFATQSTSSAKLQLNLFDYPNWQVTVDGQKVKHETTSDLALVTVDIPAGQHQVTAKLTNTPIRVGGNTLSIIAILIICASFIF